MAGCCEYMMCELWRCDVIQAIGQRLEGVRGGRLGT